MSKHNKQRRERKRLTHDWRDIMEENFPTIRRLATPELLTVAIVDFPVLPAKRVGSDEAGEGFQEFCAAREKQPVTWARIPWEETDRALATSAQWASFKALAERKGSEYIPVCCINRKDGVGIAYGFAFVPRDAVMAENQAIIVTPSECQDKDGSTDR